MGGHLEEIVRIEALEGFRGSMLCCFRNEV